MDLTGAVAVVTGGARGLGRAIAEGYVTRGAHVALVDLLEGPLAQTAADIGRPPGRAIAITADVTVADDVEAMVAEVRATLGPIDVLVNCAGSLSAIGPVWEVDRDRWLKDVMVNLYGTFLCSRAVIGEMVRRRQGYILNLYGGGGAEPLPFMSGYVASKTGVLQFTESLAREVQEYGVKVFALRPGPVRTAMTEFIMNSTEGQRWLPQFGAIFEAGRDANPDLVVALAIALVGGRADRLTGRYFDAERDLEETIQHTGRILEENLYTLRIRGVKPGGLLRT